MSGPRKFENPAKAPLATPVQSAFIGFENDMYTKARAAIAGLKRFAPKPPKAILAKIIPNEIPTATIQSGVFGGSERANISPVTRAASDIRPPFFLAKSHSEKQAKSTETPITSKLLKPKNHTEPSAAGASAQSILCIIFCFMKCFLYKSAIFFLQTK